jgi:uncharacterized membrane protein
VTTLVVNVGTPSSPVELAILFAAVLPGLALLLAFALRRAAGVRRRLLVVALAAGLLAAAAPALLAPVADAARGGWLELPDAESVRSLRATLAARGPAGAAAAAIPAATAALAALLAFGEREPRLRGALLLAACGAALVAIPEILYLRDLFGTRLNMVFKLHHAAWPPLALAAIAGCALALTRRRAAAAGGAAALVLVSGAVFAVAIAAERFERRALRALDLLAPLAAAAPDEAAAARWIRDFVPRDAIVLEAHGDSYREDHNRISRSTGRATLLGWGGHQAMWRGPAFGSRAAARVADARQIYAGVSVAAKLAALDRWGIDWIYFGPAERDRYAPSAAAADALAAVADPVFSRGGVTIWRRRGP